MTIELTTLREELDKAISTATEDAARVETLTTAVSAMEAALSSLKDEVRSAERTALLSSIRRRGCESRVNVAEANELAAGGTCTRADLLLWVSDALRTNVSGLAEAVVAKLESAQRVGGLEESSLVRTAAMHTTKTGRTMWRCLTPAQHERVWKALTMTCPKRGEGRLGTPYVLTLDS